MLFLILFACSEENQKDLNSEKEGTQEENQEEESTEENQDTEYWFVPSDHHPDNPVRIVYMGDSITAGEGAPSGSQDYPSLLANNDDDAWPDDASLDLSSKYSSFDDVIDVSFGGARLYDLVTDQLSDADQRLDDVVEGETIVVMTAGGNDVNAAVTQIWYALEIVGDESMADDAVANLKESMMSQLKDVVDFYKDPDRFPDGSYIYVANVYDPTDGVGLSSECFPGLDLKASLAYLDEINESYVELAQELGFGVIDLHQHFLGHSTYYDDSQSPYYDEQDSTLWFADCLHPNQRGHHEIRKLFYSAITGNEFGQP